MILLSPSETRRCPEIRSNRRPATLRYATSMVVVAHALLLGQDGDELTVQTVGEIKQNTPQPSLQKSQVAMLHSWAREHVGYPYPSAEQATALAEQARATTEQVSEWFADHRSRTWEADLLASKAKTEPGPPVEPPLALQEPQIATLRSWVREHIRHPCVTRARC